MGHDASVENLGQIKYGTLYDVPEGTITPKTNFPLVDGSTVVGLALPERLALGLPLEGNYAVVVEARAPQQIRAIET